jgi:pectin methylesterase-like acyl-CoA thioesterase
MKSGLPRLALGAATIAIAAAGTLTACSSTESEEKPAETSPASTSGPAVSPSEKVNIGSFTPTVTANPAPTALPGNVVTGGG